jgi:D-beta-D-heptose 7-phosphate kinase/D-beta-D-heptose 1-phosphate adenosyltransferase
VSDLGTTPGLLDRFGSLEVAVVGDVLLDAYLQGTAGRLCREAPVPVVELHRRAHAPGGAANAAANVAALGGRAALVSVTGDDHHGDVLRAALDDRGVPRDGLVRDPTRRTLALTRVLAGGQLLVRYDEGTATPVRDGAEAALLAALDGALATADAVIVSDYGYGVVTPAVVDRLARLQAERPRVLVVDAKHPAAYRRLTPTAVKPNWSEAVQLLVGLDGGADLDRAEERAEALARHGQRLLELTGAQIVAVTLDAEGAIVFEQGRAPHRTYAAPATHTGATGAGDTFVAAFTLALAAGAHTPAAAELASVAAEVVVTRPGTATCGAAELRQRVGPEDKLVTGVDRLAERVAALRSQGRRLVFTNGCFDILHRGHITYLNRAKALGDVLIVGVNDDGSVRSLKGPARPINGLDDRVRVLAALTCVDHIVAFGGESPTELIRAVRPDVYAKGGDYTVDSLPEAPLVESLGGRVHILPFVDDLSTTGIIERIRAAAAADRAASF